MINYNSLLAKHTTPVFASWVAHGLGAAAALLLVVLYSRLVRPRDRQSQQQRARAPLWCYLGGVPGAFTVILAAVTVNSSLALAGTVALMLVGQVVFGIASDHWGMFCTPPRRIGGLDLLVTLCVLSGSMLIIFGGE
jgi:transporter family-2 protein